MSSGRLKVQQRRRKDLIAKTRVEESCGIQVDGRAEDCRKLDFHLGEPEKSRNAIRQEFDEHIDIAGIVELLGQV